MSKRECVHGVPIPAGDMPARLVCTLCDNDSLRSQLAEAKEAREKAEKDHGEAVLYASELSGEVMTLRAERDEAVGAVCRAREALDRNPTEILLSFENELREILSSSAPTKETDDAAKD